MSEGTFTLRSLNNEDVKLIGEPLLSWLEILQGQQSTATAARFNMLQCVCKVILETKRSAKAFDMGQMVAFVQKAIDSINSFENSLLLPCYKGVRENVQ